ncbi:Pre-mRNA cleavage complex II protein Clp1-domain-containing protein [Chytriomyces sp. MP71]|nr:Pre-mRNA cleavage complex II protein Clp1-domain-containing protein [Chytriomyces sp. MP71]
MKRSERSEKTNSSPSAVGNSFAALRKIKKIKTEAPPKSQQLSKREALEQKVIAQLDEERSATTAQKRPVRSLFEPSHGSVVSSEAHNLSVFGMKLGQFLPFQGAALLCPIKGSFSIAGAILKARKELLSESDSVALRFYPALSPKSSSSLVIESVKAHKDVSSCQVEAVCDEKEGEGILAALKCLVSKLSEAGSAFDTIIAVKSFETSGIFGIGKKAPVYKDLFRLVVLSELNRDRRFKIEGFNAVTEYNHPHPILHIPSTWSAIGKQLTELKVNPVVCVVGSKGLGKSTMSKYLVNQLLSKHEKVAFLDCDLGQPEFTVSGQVSLHVVSDPLLSPAFAHIRQPLHSCYVGATSPKNDPDYYISCVIELWRVYVSQIPEVPLVINTDGWVKGMGFDLLMHSLKQIRPTHVVQLGIDPSSSSAAAKNIRDDLNSILNESVELHPVGICQADGFDDSLARAAPKYSAADMRSLATISYFAQLTGNPAAPYLVHKGNYSPPLTWNFGETLASRVPYSVEWKYVKLRFLNVEVPFSQSLIALNGSLVGLIEDTVAYISTKEDDLEIDCKDLRIIPSDLQIPPQHQHCVGLGIVRGIDPVSRIFYVVTPVPADQLERVNLIVRGFGMEYPASMLTDGFENVRTTVPYATYTAAEGIGAIAKKPRSNLLRRKNL